MRSSKVKYYCGRKAAFGNSYGTFVYGTNIICYVLAFLLTSASFFRSQYYLDKDAAKHQLARFKYQLLISILSIVLISTPNGISLFSQYIADVADAISKPSTYLTCVNSAINIVVYLVLYEEFRSEFVRIILWRKQVRVMTMTVTYLDK
ncbi:hypothetical protein OESDEN_16192 [Oesophagostomum dentatum]|uniref:Uncharacterized protein n=1 Tax=Oesophagostomum dentatum TaxID=61180 RepID=A0A0B1SFK6_OESDE|nr:hypothetical protein OESDEN_16192 [Oesophagostomum dentatum]